MTDPLAEQWQRRRQGSISGRGFHFQDAVATHIAILGWAGELPVQAIVPEGHEDISVQLVDGWIHTQAKSRRSHRGALSVGEVVDHLVDVWKAHEERAGAQPKALAALVVERPIRDLPTTGWGRTVAAEPVLAAGLRPRLLEKLMNSDRVEELMSSTSVVEIAEPREPSLELLSERLALPPQACVVHYESLKSLIEKLADENGELSADRAAQLSVADIQRVLDQSTALVDLESLDAAIRQGICEVVDFRTPVSDDHFFEGVDVKPGHVVAGLPVDRPELEEEVRAGLERPQPLLIVGPSGAGKSAIAWMTAFASRHLIRWYRVRRLGSADVVPLLRTVRAVRPSDRSPVGLIVDDLGRGDRQGWDALVEEVAQLQGIRLIGIAREEDLAIVQTASICLQVRPVLEESLATRIWENLRSSGATTWEDWREPYELSEGLLLEYGYLLTTGERLVSTITSQIDRRMNESRDLELRILRLVGVADIWGARVRLDALRGLLDGERDEELQRALARLLDEHLVRESVPGVFGGLHQIRSRYIVEAAHRFGVPTLAETICQALSLLDAHGLQPLVAGALTESAAADDVVLVGLTNRLKADCDPQLLISALQSLRLVSFLRVASGWPQILDEEGVPPSKKLLAAELALAGITSESFSPSIRAAITRMTPTLQDDLRMQLLRVFGEEDVHFIIERVEDLETATLLLAALVGTPADSRLSAQLLSLKSIVDGAAIENLAHFLAVARAVDPDLARQFADSAGGSQPLLQRIEHERPWIRDLRVVADEEGRQVVEGIVRTVSPSTQTDVHADVVELCRLVLSCVPDAEIAACRAVDASGALAGYGNYKIANKRIPRKNLPSDAAVAWNRTRFRAIADLLAAETHTERLVAERSLLARTARALDQVADYWCRDQRLPQSLSKELSRIATETEALPPPPLTVAMHVGPLDQGTLEETDPVNALLSGVVQTVVSLFNPAASHLSLAAFIHDSLFAHANGLIDVERWRLLSDPPHGAIQKLRRCLADLHAVVAESHCGGREARTKFAALARRTQSSTCLPRCAEAARERAERRLDRRAQRLIEELGRRGLTSHVFRRRPAKPSGLVWPFDEICVLVEIPSVFEWPQVQACLVTACQGAFELQRSVVAAPVRDGRVVVSLGGSIQSQFYLLPDLLLDWRANLPLHVLEEEAAARYWQAAEALVEISGILGGTKGRLHPSEGAAVEAATSRFRHAVDLLTPMAEDDQSEFVAEAVVFLGGLSLQVQDQLKAFELGQENDPAVATAFLAPARNQVNETVNTAGLIRMELIERDIDPLGARRRLDLALQRLTGPPEADPPHQM